MSVPADADATRLAHWRALLRGRAGTFALVIGAAAGLVAGAASGHALLALVLPLAWVALVAAIAFAVADRRAAADFYTALAASLEFRFLGDTTYLGLTPLLAGGDRRRWEDWMVGERDGRPTGLGHYVYECEHRDSNGNRTWRSHEFTLCLVDVPEATSFLRGVFARPRRSWLGRLEGDDWLGRTRKRRTHVESTAFEERYELWALEDQDEIALRRLLSPTMLVWLAEHPLPLGVELYGGTLAVYLERSREDAGNLVALLDAARHLAGRAAEETAGR